MSTGRLQKNRDALWRSLFQDTLPPEKPKTKIRSAGLVVATMSRTSCSFSSASCFWPRKRRRYVSRSTLTAQVAEIVADVFDEPGERPQAQTPDRSIGSNAPRPGEHERDQARKRTNTGYESTARRPAPAVSASAGFACTK